MAICRYHIFIWKDQSGMFTAVPVEDLDEFGEAGEEIAAVGITEQEAKQQLGEFLTWLFKNDQAWPEPALEEVKCMEFAVSLRPEYQERSRVFPCDYQMRVPFVCVHGKLGDELRFGSVPYLGLPRKFLICCSGCLMKGVSQMCTAE